MIILFALLEGVSASYEEQWGISYDDFINSTGQQFSYNAFDPLRQPEYTNRIVRFLSALNRDSEKTLVVVRLNSVPEKDYLFFNRRLCAVTENLGIIDSSEGEDILKQLMDKYTAPDIETRGSLTVYTFNSGRTSIILYQQLHGRDKMRCRVYFYTRDLFNTLFE